MSAKFNDFLCSRISTTLLLLASAGFAASVVTEANAAAPKVDFTVQSRPQNLQWGGFPPDLPPVITVPSGSTVRVHTLSHAGATSSLSPTDYLGAFGVKPGEILADVFAFWDTLPPRGTRMSYGGGHVLTGPIYIAGAEPGDTLEVQILDMKTRVPYGINNTSPTGGALGTAYPGFREGDVPLDIPPAPPGTPGNLAPDVRQHLYRTGKYKGQEVAFAADNIRVPLKPFFGIMATTPTEDAFVGNTADSTPPVPGVQHSTPPWKFGGNIDSNQLGAGTTLYLPVFKPGAQFYVGDPHSVQGDGEVSGTAIEHSLTGIIKFVLHKGRTIEWPYAENKDFYLIMGFDHDLDRAMRNAVYQTVQFLKTEKGLTDAKAFSLSSIGIDYVASEVVDRTQVVTGKVPKKFFLKKPGL